MSRAEGDGASPLPRPTTHEHILLGGRVGERAGAASTNAPLARARACIGARFRLHGRSAEDGLDCVGLAGVTYGVEPPRGYALRSGDAAAVIAGVAGAGLVRGEGARPGDLLLFRAGPGQLHLAIQDEGGVIHADASLRRVVMRPGVPPWPLLGRWRRED